jgi:hypothetical protein
VTPNDKIKPIRLYSPRTFNGLSRARFARNRRAILLRHLRREPTGPESMIIARVIMLDWLLAKTDHQLETGEELSGHALRARLAAENRMRLDLKMLGLDGPIQRKLTPEEALAAAHAAARVRP